MPSVNENLQDRAVQHAIAINRYGVGLSDRIVKLLNSADDEIVAKIAQRIALIDERGYDLGLKSTKRLLSLLDEIRALNSAIYDELHDSLADELNSFATAEAGFQKAALDSSLLVDLSTKLPAPARLKAIVEETPMEGRLLKSWTTGMEQARVDRVTQAIRLGMTQGETTDQIVRRIKGTKAARYTDGVLDISRRSAQSIVRTSVNHVSNVAAQETWKANSHVVKAWQFLATLDTRTTIGCASLDGKTFPIGEGPIPPRHIRCRSISVAVTKSFRELGIDKDELSKAGRASMDGQIADAPRFAEWLKRKGTDMQDKLLGPTRAELFRSGKLDLDQFVRADGTLLTLNQLEQSYPQILK
ncbi:minor capsid protein [Sphingobium yanoikuyae]|jgi:SPP1 gp7 family putative phage head morphogenesis protein|uniref:minor capsid protein n=1 Tax=Sphingobium yanoikuyae TaxID=13690 RepID=UPI0028A7F288|nr:minor capsid protein [Sphingobium yanoikuyae]